MKRGLICTDILDRPVRTTARNPLALEAGYEIAALRLDGPQTAPSSPNRGLNKSAHGRMADRDDGSDGHHVGLDRD